MNYYTFEKTTRQKLKPNGSVAESERFIVCEPLDVCEGDRITFGPTRLGAPVMGVFYDAEDQPLAILNYANVEIAHSFKEGMVMATAIAPAGAKAIRLQLPLQDKEFYHIYINEECPKMEEPKNPLYGRNVLTVGDSLCAAAKDVAVDGMKGWARRIRDHFGANVTNAGVGGAACSNCRIMIEKYSFWHQIFRQITRFEGEYDYILLEGGGNDAWDKAPLGRISDSFDPSTFDLTTYAGGMEMLIYTAVKEYGDTAAIGHMSIFKTPHYFKTLFSGDYFALGKEICQKWGIEYLDIYNNVEFDTVQYTVDGIHANAAGYDVLQPYINAFLPKMRPVSKAIYDKVQKL